MASDHSIYQVLTWGSKELERRTLHKISYKLQVDKQFQTYKICFETGTKNLHTHCTVQIFQILNQLVKQMTIVQLLHKYCGSGSTFSLHTQKKAELRTSILTPTSQTDREQRSIGLAPEWDSVWN